MSKNKVQSVKLFFLPHNDLEMLRKHSRNRLNEDNKSHVKKLKNSMQAVGFSDKEPIIIDSDFVIQDGHNRYQAALEAGVGVWYKIDDDFDLLRDNKRKGLAKKWNTLDYIRGYSHEKGGAYQTLLDIYNQYGNQISLKVIIASAVGISNEASGCIFDSFANGDFEFPEGISYQTMVEDMEEVLALNSFMNTNFRKTKTHAHFSLSYFWIREQDGFDKKKFFHKLATMQKQVLPQVGGQKPNRMKLIEIYNFNLKKDRIQMPSMI